MTAREFEVAQYLQRHPRAQMKDINNHLTSAQIAAIYRMVKKGFVERIPESAGSAYRLTKRGIKSMKLRSE